MAYRDEKQKPSDKSRKRWLGPAAEHWPIQTVWFALPGERQPPLSSDSDASIITGVEVGMSNVGLSMEPEGEVFAKSWSHPTSDRKRSVFAQDPTTSVSTCSSSVCRPDSRSHFSASENHINLNISLPCCRGWTWLEERPAAAVTLPTKLSFSEFDARSLPTLLPWVRSTYGIYIASSWESVWNNTSIFTQCSHS